MRHVRLIVFAVLSLLWSWVLRLADSVVTDWIAAQIGQLFGVTSPTALEVVAFVATFGPPVLLAGVTLYVYHLWWTRYAKPELAAKSPIETQLPTSATRKPPDQPTADAQSEIKPTGKQERVFVSANITAEYLISIFREHTDIQGTRLVEAYVGKWMRVTGALSNVMSSSKSFAQVTFEKRDVPLEERTWFDYATVFMYFHDTWIDRVAILKRGDKLTVIGQIKQVEGTALHLDNCELVSD